MDLVIESLKDYFLMVRKYNSLPKHERKKFSVFMEIELQSEKRACVRRRLEAYLAKEALCQQSPITMGSTKPPVD